MLKGQWANASFQRPLLHLLSQGFLLHYLVFVLFLHFVQSQHDSSAQIGATAKESNNTVFVRCFLSPFCLLRYLLFPFRERHVQRELADDICSGTLNYRGPQHCERNVPPDACLGGDDTLLRIVIQSQGGIWFTPQCSRAEQTIEGIICSKWTAMSI
jgi:hypothetical protein